MGDNFLRANAPDYEAITRYEPRR